MYVDKREHCMGLSKDLERGMSALIVICGRCISDMGRATHSRVICGRSIYDKGRDTRSRVICGRSIYDKFTKTYCKLQVGSYFGVRYEGFGVNALFSWNGGVVARWRDFPRIGEIHRGDLEEVQVAGLSINLYTHGY
jgi:hypothetical protein